MPEIIVTTGGRGDRPTEVHREQVDTAQIESETASHLLVERIGWALSDAETLEQEDDTDEYPRAA